MKTTMKIEKKRIPVADDLASNTFPVKLYLERTDDYVFREETRRGQSEGGAAFPRADGGRTEYEARPSTV
jgi:hypothetical protein